MTIQEEKEAISEMLEVAKQYNFSYYDLEKYVYEQRNEWIPLLTKRNTRRTISECLKWRKKKADVSYIDERHKAMRRATEAKAKYEEKQFKEFIENIEAQIESKNSVS